MAQPDVDQLNSFLRGELSAIETYRQAIEKMSDEPLVRDELTRLQSSHQKRASMLQTEIRRLGGEPATDSGVWGSFAKLVEGGAKLFGKKAALSALEEGEDHGRNDYQRDMSDLTTATRTFVVQNILPEQQRTHDALNQLQSRL